MRYASATDVGSDAVFHNCEIQMEILLFERASKFSHSLGQLPSPNFVASGDRTCFDTGRR
jgi:hypothetical protein